jgi:hypothetical protein
MYIYIYIIFSELGNLADRNSIPVAINRSPGVVCAIVERSSGRLCDNGKEPSGFSKL